jgi:hypothetical protein
MQLNSKVTSFFQGTSKVFLAIPIIFGVLAFTVSLLIEIQALTILTNSVFLLYGTIAMELAKVSLIFLYVKNITLKFLKYMFILTFFSVSFMCSLLQFGNNLAYDNLSSVIQNEIRAVNVSYNQRINTLINSKETILEINHLTTKEKKERLLKEIEYFDKQLKEQEKDIHDSIFVGKKYEQYKMLKQEKEEELSRLDQIVMQKIKSEEELSKKITALETEKQKRINEIKNKVRINDSNVQNSFLNTMLYILKSAFGLDLNYYKLVFWITLLLAFSLEIIIYLSSLFIKFHLIEKDR